MGAVGVFAPLLVAFSLLQGGCWAGPIDTQLKTPRNLKKPERIAPRNAVPATRLHTRNPFTSESISPVLRPRSNGRNNSMWAVTAVVGIILLLCLLVIGVVLIRRSKRRHLKAASDEELGFGKHPKAQPDLAPLPRSYDGMSTVRSPPVQAIEQSEDSENIRKPPPPPLLTISPPEELGQKPRRVPVPQLPALPPSPRLVGLPPSPRLIGLPPSPRLPASPRTQRPSSGSHLSEPQNDLDVPSSPRGLPSPSLGPPSANNDHALEVPLSAGGLERMITRMEMELNEDT
jgi:hypothetical protein